MSRSASVRTAAGGSPQAILERWAVPRAWHTNLTLLILGTGLLLLSRQLVNEYDDFTIGFSGVSGWSLILYVLAVFVVLTQPTDRFTFWIILSVAIACRLSVLYADPYLSSDVYRYAWDGVVQHAHISPYRYVPGDKALTFLREPNRDLFDNINRRDYARTIYPPAAQFLFYLITFVSPTMTFMKTAMVLFEGITLWSLVKLLQWNGRRREQALLYTWCPLLIWEIGGSGHLDSAAMAFLSLALLSRYRRSMALTGLFLGLAVMTKMYPLVLFPALYLRRDWKMPVVLAAVVAGGYAAYSSVGGLVLGFLGGYVQEEGMSTGVRYFLLELAQRVPGLQRLSTATYVGFSVLVFVALSVWAWKTCCRAEAAAGAFLPVAFSFAAALMLLFSPHYAWYLAWLVPFLALLPNLPIFAYVMGFFYLYTTALGAPGPKMFLANEILYGVTAAAACLHLLLQLWPVHRPIFRTCAMGEGA